MKNKSKGVLSVVLSVLLLFTSFTLAQPVLAEDSGTIKINVSDNSGNSLTGYDFAIRNSSGSRVSVDGSYGVYSYGGGYEVITSNGGVIQIHGIPTGTYSVQYIGTDSSLKFNDGYFTIANGQTSFLDMVGIKQTGSVRIRLTGVGGEALSGVRFHITRDGSTINFVSNGSSYEEYSMGSSALTTDSSGTISISSIAAGNYILTQENMVDGYNSTPVSESFYVAVGQNSNISVANSKIYSALKISSVDENNSKVAAVVNVKKDGKNISAFNTGTNQYEYSSNAGVEDFTVSDDITITGLPFENYTVSVSSVGDNYSKAGDVSVSLDSTSGKAIVLKNAQKGTKLTLSINDSDGAVSSYPVQILSGTDTLKFKQVASGVYEYVSSNGADELTSASNGTIVITGIPDGTVKVRLKQADGYKKPGTAKSVKLTTGTPATLDLEVERADKKTIVLATDSTMPFAGSKLAILDGSNAEVYSTELTDETSIDISSLEDGNYKYKLTNLPDGYVNKEYSGSFKVSNGELPNSPKINLEPMNISVKVPEGVTDVSLFDNNGEEIQASVTNGIATFKDVIDGKYIVKVGDEERIIDVNRSFKENNISFVEEVEPETNEPNLGPGTEGNVDVNENKFPWWIILIPLLLAAILITYLLTSRKKYKKQTIDASEDDTVQANNDIDAALAMMSTDVDNASEETEIVRARDLIDEDHHENLTENLTEDLVPPVLPVEPEPLPTINERDTDAILIEDTSKDNLGAFDSLIDDDVQVIPADVDVDLNNDNMVSSDELIQENLDSIEEEHHQVFEEVPIPEVDEIPTEEDENLIVDEPVKSTFKINDEAELPEKDPDEIVLSDSDVVLSDVNEEIQEHAVADLPEDELMEGFQKPAEIEVASEENKDNPADDIIIEEDIKNYNEDIFKSSEEIPSNDESLLDKIEDKADDVKEVVSSKVEDFKDNIEDNEIFETIRDVKENISDKVEKASDAVEEKVEDVKEIVDEGVKAATKKKSDISDSLRRIIAEARKDIENSN